MDQAVELFDNFWVQNFSCYFW